MLVKIYTFNKMYTAANELYISRIGDGCLNEEEKIPLVKACQRVVYIIFNDDIDDAMAECTQDEGQLVFNIKNCESVK